VQLFRKNPEILARYQERYIHVMVDEFQDTNMVQYELIKQVGAKYRNICVVGDPDQSIYSWRAADLRNILSFEHDYPDAKVVLLEQNYRSTKKHPGNGFQRHFGESEAESQDAVDGERPGGTDGGGGSLHRAGRGTVCGA